MNFIKTGKGVLGSLSLDMAAILPFFVSSDTCKVRVFSQIFTRVVKYRNTNRYMNLLLLEFYKINDMQSIFFYLSIGKANGDYLKKTTATIYEVTKRPKS